MNYFETFVLEWKNVVQNSNVVQNEGINICYFK